MRSAQPPARLKGNAKTSNLHLDLIEFSLSLSTIDADTRNQLLPVARDAVPFRIDREPAGMTEWSRVYGAALDLARKEKLVLPAAAVYFPFELSAGGQFVRLAVVARQTAAQWQHWVVLEMPSRLLPITMCHFPDRMMERRMPSSLTWLENGGDAWPDANELLIRTDTGLPASARQWIAHIAVQGGELLLHLAVAMICPGGIPAVRQLLRPGRA